MKKKVTPTRDRPTNVRVSLPSKIAELSGLLTFCTERATRNNAPATRNLNVAIAIGVSPCKSNVFTTTNELPQKIIRHNIKKKSNKPIFSLAIFPPLHNRATRQARKIWRIQGVANDFDVVFSLGLQLHLIYWFDGCQMNTLMLLGFPDEEPSAWLHLDQAMRVKLS